MSIKKRVLGPSLIYILTAATCLLLNAAIASATVQYVSDGAVPDGNGWKLPQQGTCPAFGANGYTPEATVVTRPECVAMRLNIPAASCIAPNLTLTSSGVCNDLVNNTEPLCNAAPDRLWNPSTSICSVIMRGDDRNNVTCAIHGATWVTTATCTGTWVSGARTDYTPNLLTSNGPGDQCLRCHNSLTQYNGPRVRDTEDTMYMGHKNMARKVVAGQPWGGPHQGTGFKCFILGVINPAVQAEEVCEILGGWWQPSGAYTTDDAGNAINWATGKITAGGVDQDLLWIYGDWLAPLPRSIYRAPASATANTCSDPRYTAATCVANGGTLLNGAGMSYSCARCHTTGWTSDATIKPSTGIEGKEPEESFPGVTWDRNSNAGFGVVNLSGGVLNDPNKYASWDVWGIACSRCHGSSIETTSVVAGSTPPQYNAPTGMSSHHSSMTSPTGDQCTLPNFTAATCVANGGTVITASGTAACSLAGICNTLNPAHSDATLCANAGGQWAAATDIVRCEDIHEYGVAANVPAYAAATFTGTATNRGQIITRLCMDCHRQETTGVPYADALAANGQAAAVAGGDYSLASPGMYLKVGPAHGTISPVSHPHGSMFLNSPHGQFTGNFNQIATAKLGTGYGSFFQTEGEAANTGNGCTGCHNVHKSTLPGVNEEDAIKEECTECHSKNLNVMLHPKGIGTPLEHMASAPAEACETCHMPGGLHLFRINTDANYSTYPTACTSNSDCATTYTVNANTAADGAFANAVWVDVDAACGQCHGGGTREATGTGPLVLGAGTGAVSTVTVADGSSFDRAQRVVIAGAGALEPDGVSRSDFESYIRTISGNTITLAGQASVALPNATIDQNPTKNGGAYMNKATLAGLAANIHNDAPFATFSYKLGATTLTAVLNASGSACSGSNANCDAYVWDYGDGSPIETKFGVNTTTHVYAAAGIYPVTLTVEEFGVGNTSTTRTVKVYTPNPPPAVGGTACGSILDANTWIGSMTDSSTDADGIKQVTMSWGDGSMTESKAAGQSFSHAYKAQPILACTGADNRKIVSATNSTTCAASGGTWGRYFFLTQKAVDNLGQIATRYCTVTPVPFTANGIVYRNATTTPIPSVILSFKLGATTVATAYSSAAGTFSIGNLKPGNYTVTAAKLGYTFPIPAAAFTVGGNATGVTIYANP